MNEFSSNNCVRPPLHLIDTQTRSIENGIKMQKKKGKKWEDNGRREEKGRRNIREKNARETDETERQQQQPITSPVNWIRVQSSIGRITVLGIHITQAQFHACRYVVRLLSLNVGYRLRSLSLFFFYLHPCRQCHMLYVCVCVRSPKLNMLKQQEEWGGRKTRLYL